jgi:arabinogalactan oligomer/maltooligosaccharide transport system substrate-binding protein
MFIALLLVFLVSFAGQAKVPITMWLSSQPAGVTAWAEQFEKAFNAKYPDIELTVEVYPNVTAQREKLIVSIAAGAGPDVVYDSNNLMAQWYNNGIALPIDRYLDTWAYTRDLMPDMLNQMRFAGKTYGMPYSVWSTGDVYNLDVFNGQGVALPNSWNEMIATAKKLHKVDADGRSLVVGYNMGISDLSGFIEMQLAMDQLGSTVIEIDAKTASLKTDAARQALTYLRDVVQAGMPAGSIGSSNIGDMLAGRMAIYHSYNGYRLVEVADAISKDNIDLAYRRFVGHKAGEDAIQANGGMLMITSSSKYPDQAWIVIQEFMERENLKGYMLAHGSVLPTRYSMHSDNDLRSLPWNRELMAVMTPPVLAYGSRHPLSTDFRLQAGAQLKKALLGTASVEEALSQAQAAIDAILADRMK